MAISHAFERLDPGLFPLGQRGPRGSVLRELKRAGPITAKDLAARLGLSPNTIRHHLKELTAEGLVEHESRHHGVGAPVFVYRLTAAGAALFPVRYQETLTEVLDHIVEREGREAAVEVLQQHFTQLSRRLRPGLEGAGARTRVAAVVETLSREGYMAEGWTDETGGSISHHNCAILSVAERFPEICAAEARFLAEVLGAEVERKTHILGGCSACEYRLRFPAALSAAESIPQAREEKL